MPIRMRPAPADCDAAFRAAWARRPSGTAAVERGRGGGEAEPWAYPTYVVPLQALAEGLAIAASAKPDGWRHLVQESGGWSAAEVADRGGAQRVTCWNHGPFNAAMVAATRALEASSDAAEGDYELRLLQVPGLCIHAMWLLDAAAGRSVLMPLAPTDPALEPRRVYSGEEFVASLAGSARRRLQMPDRP